METGRVNQKRRTRAAIVNAALELVRQGATPTVAQAAEAALVSRTTAYRYFPTQESLLLEVAVHTDVDEIEELIARPPEDGDPVDRLLQVIRDLNRHVLADEVRYRMAARLYIDMWLSAVAEGEEAPVVREGRRIRWFTDVLAPLRDELSEEGFARLIAALSLVAGAESMIVLRDVAHLDEESAVEVAEWAAKALISAALAEEGVERRT